MANTAKMTFTLDTATAERIDRAAQTLSIPKSAVVRNAVEDYTERLGLLSEGEKRRLLALFDRMIPALPRGSGAAVDRELAELRRARRQGGSSAGLRRSERR